MTIHYSPLEEGGGSDPRDNIPTLVILDADGFLVQAGSPECANNKQLGEYALAGYSIQTMSFKEYKSLNLTWIYDKPKNQHS
jgi:hypothetical protein